MDALPSASKPLAKLPFAPVSSWHRNFATALPFDAPGDVTYGSIRTQLELAGTPIGGNDLLIAAQTMALDFTLVTDNEQEFSRIGGLRVENWLRD